MICDCCNQEIKGRCYGCRHFGGVERDGFPVGTISDAFRPPDGRYPERGSGGEELGRCRSPLLEQGTLKRMSPWGHCENFEPKVKP